MSERGSGEERRLEELRRELRSLGYLEGRLERYLLHDLLARPGLLRPAVRASLRLALAGGPLVAALTTACLALWHPALASRPLDLAVLYGYSAALTVLGGFALALAAAVFGLTSSGRPRQSLVRIVASATAAVWLAWLGPWVLVRGTGVLRAVALLALGAVALRLGRMGGRTALVLALDRAGAVSRSRSEAGVAAPGSREPDSEPVETRRTVLLLVVSLLGLVALVVAGSREPEGPPAARIEAQPGSASVMLLAIDGAGRDDLEGGLGAASERLRDFAGRGSLRALDPGPIPVPPVVWTTVATGRAPLDHGVRSLLVERVPGLDTAFPSGYGRDALAAVIGALAPLPPPRVPLSDQLRREKAFWEVAAEAGSPVLVVNWWATYPASIARGVVVSDRAYATLVSGREMTREVDPPELGSALAAAFRAAPAAAPATGGGEGPAALARAGDRFHAELLLERLSASRPQVAALYLQALDVIAVESRSAEERQAAKAAYGAWLDTVLERLAAGIGPGRALVVVAHPGRGRPRAPGFVLVAGGPAASAAPPGTAPARLEDVAPTVLALLGLPISAEQAGRILLDPAYLAAHPLGRVPSFGRRRAEPAPAFDPTDRAAAERLRSLGYVN